MIDLELKKYRYDMRNDFLSEMYEFHKSYSDRLYFLNISDEDNLALVIKNKIWEFAEAFESIDYNYFYQTEIGNAIICLFSDVLETEEDKLYYQEASVHECYINYWCYRAMKRVLPGKWLVEYRNLCNYYKNVSLDSVMNIIVEKFKKNLELEEDDSEVKLLLIDDFNRELEFLINSGNVDKKYNSCLVKKIS